MSGSGYGAAIHTTPARWTPFMDALIAAVEARAKKEGDAAYTARLEAVCEIRAEMTEQVMRAMLEAEKKIAPILAAGENY